ncbi:MAG TPA: dCTP deaminase [Candidatus Saccharimonadales bacterium]|nr:dCTP deaminase [Candidatus Saccharimonadales bacterium]
MVLSGQTIKKLISEKKIKINPYSEDAVGAVSVDLHLDQTALNPENGKEVDLHDFHLSLDEFYLASTMEFVQLPSDIVARVIPRSSLARLGVLCTFDADILPPNYAGKPLLTFKNLSRKSVLLKPGLAVAQILFEQVDQEVEGYSSRYDHKKIEESKLCEEMVDGKNR